MNNCYFRKLEISADNSNLLEVGEKRFSLRKSARGDYLDEQFQVWSDKNETVLIKSLSQTNGFGSTHGTNTVFEIPLVGSTSMPGMSGIYYVNADNNGFDISISNIYGAAQLIFGDCFEGNLEDIKYCEKLYGFQSGSLSGNIKVLDGAFKAVNTFSTPPTSLVILSSPNIYGDIKDFGKNIVVTTLRLGNGRQSSKIGGDIEDLLDAMVANGRNSGTLAILGNGIVKYNNSPVAYDASNPLSFTFSDSGWSPV